MASRRSIEHSLDRNATTKAGASRGYCASKASFFCCRASPKTRQRPKVATGRRSTGLVGKEPYRGSCAPPRVSRGCEEIGTASGGA
jgi:hypothetical protein